MPQLSPLRCPKWLPPEAKRVWRRIAPLLEQRGVLTSWDVDALVCYCVAVVQHRQATELLASEGLVVEGARGGQVKHPAFQLARDSAQLIRSFGQEFGLTPSARTRVRPGDHLPDDPDLDSPARLLT